MNDDLGDRVCGIGSETWKGCKWEELLVLKWCKKRDFLVIYQDRTDGDGSRKGLQLQCGTAYYVRLSMTQMNEKLMWKN